MATARCYPTPVFTDPRCSRSEPISSPTLNLKSVTLGPGISLPKFQCHPALKRYDLRKLFFPLFLTCASGNLKFYITSEGESFYYTYVVYHRSVVAQKNGGVTFLKPCSTYLENIKWIWKRGKLHEMHNFKGWQDKKSWKYGDSNAGLTISELDKMSVDEIKSTLSLKEYERWLHIRELENKEIN